MRRWDCIWIFFIAAAFSVTVLGVENKVMNKGKWKTFTSDYGFTFKYPDCWEVRPDTPDVGLTLEKTDGLAAVEGAFCKTSRLDSSVPNAVSVHAIPSEGGDASEEGLQEKKKKIKDVIKNRDYIFFQDRMIDGRYAYIFVDKPSLSKIRWNMNIDCGDHEITVGLPSIRDPDESYFKKFKAGDMALPEPYKSIYDSVRCTEYKMPQPPAEEAKPEVEPEPKKRAKPAKRAKEPQKYNIIKLLEDPLKKMKKK